MIEGGVQTVDVEKAVAFEAAGGFFDVRPDDLARSVDATCLGLDADDIGRRKPPTTVTSILN
jgi:hypothetical protein